MEYSGGILKMLVEELNFILEYDDENHKALRRVDKESTAYIFGGFCTIYKKGKVVFESPDFSEVESFSIVEIIKEKLQ